MGKKAMRLALALSSVLLLGGGTAFAAIPSSENDPEQIGGGEFYGCSSEVTGVLRLVDLEAGESCKFKESPVRWNSGHLKLSNGRIDGGDPAQGGKITLAAHASNVFVTAHCPEKNSHPFNVQYAIDGFDQSLYVKSSTNSSSGPNGESGWQMVVSNNADVPHGFSMSVLCIAIGQ